MAESILVVDNVTKTYPGVKALDQVSLEFRKGEIHALVGEMVPENRPLLKRLQAPSSQTAVLFYSMGKI